jgi:cellulose synthase/poly-beta-1,6-N-acetylglucosamine synthase-like glycosyltransferase
MLYLYYFIAALSCWFGVQSLRGGLRFRSYVIEQLNRSFREFQPFVSVIAPSRGLEPGLKDNIRALLEQKYPSYEVVFVLDDETDPALELINAVTSHTNNPSAEFKTVIAGPALNAGQKVHNLRMAVNEIAPHSQALVFVDTDARPHPEWLRDLVRPLADQTVGAVTGYRWFVPLRGGFASRLRSVWNGSIASALGGDTAKNFCWGGSTAIRRSTFDQLNIRDRWLGTVSDDFLVTRVLKEAKLPIYFAPQCFVPSVGDCNFSELLEFTTRQIKITRVYSSGLWKTLLLGSSMFTIAFFGGLLLSLVRIVNGSSFVIPAGLVLVMFVLGSLKAYVRLKTVNLPLRNYTVELQRDLLAHVFFWPLASVLYLYNSIVAGFSRRINWRGITYELKTPTEAVIISREPL